MKLDMKGPWLCGRARSRCSSSRLESTRLRVDSKKIKINYSTQVDSSRLRVYSESTWIWDEKIFFIYLAHFVIVRIPIIFLYENIYFTRANRNELSKWKIFFDLKSKSTPSRLEVDLENIESTQVDLSRVIYF